LKETGGRGDSPDAPVYSLQPTTCFPALLLECFIVRRKVLDFSSPKTEVWTRIANHLAFSRQKTRCVFLALVGRLTFSVIEEVRCIEQSVLSEFFPLKKYVMSVE
jgi:hypothetical protein